MTLDDYQRAFFSPLDDPPTNCARDLDANQGPASYHSAGTVAETLTRLQVDMARRNGEELNRMKQALREEMSLAMQEMREHLRERERPVQTDPRQENHQHAHRPPTITSWRRGNNRAGEPQRLPNMTQRDSSLKIEQWGIKFDGDTSKITIDDFIFRVEHLKSYHGLSWQEVMGDFHKLLGQKASEWYWIQVRMTDMPDWPTLRTALRRTYSSRLTNFELERELMERTQKPGEMIDDYIHEMCRLRAQLRTPIEETEMVRVLKRNIRESVGKILFPMNITSVENLRAEYHAVEKAFMRTRASLSKPLPHDNM